MKPPLPSTCLLALLLAAGTSRAEMAMQRLKPMAGAPQGILRFEVPKGAKVHRADLLIFRAAEIAGTDDEALTAIEIVPVLGAEQGKALELRAPWFDRLDATEAVKAWAAGAANNGFLVKACPRWKPEASRLDVAFEGTPEKVPPQAGGLRVVHRAGQTFVVFEEIDERSAAPAPTWAELKSQLEQMDAEREVRYRVYRHDAPITAESLPAAEWLGDVRPLSGYNVLGRSVDQLIALHRRRAIDDIEFAKQLARQDYFSRYHPDMAEMGEVRIQRLAIEDGRPLPPKTGLYVHHPAKAGNAFYAVVSVVDGVANTAAFSPANSLAKAARGEPSEFARRGQTRTDRPPVGPVEETVGHGEPVLQGKADVTVFFDYPGERRQLVQWAAPPLANLPNQYCNWGAFVPAGYEKAEVRRLSVFFHDGRQRFLKPPWPHRRDTVLLSPHDAPYRGFGYGYHESLGTLRSFRQGKVRPFLALRVDAMVAWALREFGADPGRVSCGGRGNWGGTAALQYGLRRPGKVAYVMAEDSPDPDPQQTPYEFSFYGRGDKSTTQRPTMDAVWGKAEWKVEAAGGTAARGEPSEFARGGQTPTDRPPVGPIWEEMNLVAHVRATGPTTPLPFLSLGAGSMHLTWKQETDLMKAYLETGNAFMAEFFWGSSAHLHLPVTADQGDHPFEPRADRPLLACVTTDRGPNPDFFPKHFDTGTRGYSGGGRLNTRPRWGPEDIVDAPDRLEMTLYCARHVVYAGRVTCDVVVRNTGQFRPKPGEKLLWTAPDPRDPRKTHSGDATVDEHGRIHIPKLQFGEPGRLVIRRAAEKEGEQ